MGKVILGGFLGLAAIGAFLGLLDTAANLGHNTDPVTRQATKAADALPGATLDSLKGGTDAISGNKATDASASRPTYNGTKTTVDSVSATSKVLGIIGAVLPWVLRVTVVLGAIALITRTIARGRRVYRTYEIISHRENTISTEQLRSFMSAMTTLMYVRSRRLQRVFVGAPSMAFCVLSSPNRKRGDSEVGIYVKVPADLNLDRALKYAFSDAYQDSVLKVVRDWPSWGKEIVRLKKTRAIPYTLRVPGISQASESFQEGFNSPVMDKVVSMMSSRQLAAEVQYVVTACPRPFDRLVRAIGRIRHESRTDAIEQQEGSNTASASASEGHLFTEIRVGTPDYEFSRDIAAVLAGAAGGDAQLRERRPIFRKPLYQERFFEGIGNPIPSWLYGVLSTSELSSLWQLPSAQLRSISIKRTNRRRISVPPEVYYPDRLQDSMFLSPEGKGMALIRSDLKYGSAFAGQQGMAKTVLMAAVACGLLNADRRFAALICDPKGDLADETLAMLAKDRKVHYIEVGNPKVGIDPFLLTTEGMSEQDIVNVVLHGIIDVVRTEDGDSQIMASSKDFLTRAIFATVATTIPFGIRPTMHHLSQWVSTDPEDVKWQQQLLTDVISHRPDLHFVSKGFAAHHSSLERSEAQVTTRALAPANKIAELCQPIVDQVLRHPNAINLDLAIKSKEVIIVNGNNHPSADLIFRMLWQMVDQSLGRMEAEGKHTGADPVKFLFAVDESPSVLTKTTAQIIARRRSAGLHMMLGWQHDSQIADPQVLSTLTNLLQNFFQFRTSPEDARSRIDLMQMTFDDQQDSRLREARLNRVSVADLINLDLYTFYAAHLVNGNRIPAYWAQTVDPATRPDYSKAHLHEQDRDGGHNIDILAAPDLVGQSRKARERMLFDPPKFPEVTDADSYKQSLMASVDVDFEAALATNDPASGQRDPDDSQDSGAGGETPEPVGDEPPVRSPDARDLSSAATTAPTVEDQTPPAGRPDNRNGVVHTSALDEEIELSREQATADASEVAIEANGFNEDRPRKTIAEIAKAEVGPLGQTLPGELSLLLEVVDGFRDLDANTPIFFEDPPEEPSSSISARNAKAEQLANSSSLFPANWHKILVTIYEFNYLTTEQIEIFTGIGKTGVSKRMNLWLANGVVRGMKVGRRRIWSLTDLGARCGRQLTSRFGPLIPLEPGRGEEGRYEASRKWTARNSPNPKAIFHDLHLASYVTRFILLCDGDLRVFDNPQEGIIQRFRGEFGSVMEPPMVRGRRGQQTPLDLNSMAKVTRGLGFSGVDSEDPSFGSLSPDAIIAMHNLAPQESDPKKGRREVWIELDRQGHVTKLRDKLTRFDAFLGVWWMGVARYRKAGISPTVIFVAPNTEVLKKMLAIADETLIVRSGQTRLGSQNWGTPNSRERIFFALEPDIHKGSLRVYRVPAKTPQERAADASDQRERTEVRAIAPRMDNLLPDRLLAGRRLGTHPLGNR